MRILYMVERSDNSRVKKFDHTAVCGGVPGPSVLLKSFPLVFGQSQCSRRQVLPKGQDFGIVSPEQRVRMTAVGIVTDSLALLIASSGLAFAFSLHDRKNDKCALVFYMSGTSGSLLSRKRAKPAKARDLPRRA